MDRKLEDKLNIALTRDERVILWNLVSNEYDSIVNNNDELNTYQKDRLQKLKTIEILIIG